MVDLPINGGISKRGKYGSVLSTQLAINGGISKRGKYGSVLSTQLAINGGISQRGKYGLVLSTQLAINGGISQRGKYGSVLSTQLAISAGISKRGKDGSFIFYLLLDLSQISHLYCALMIDLTEIQFRGVIIKMHPLAGFCLNHQTQMGQNIYFYWSNK